MKIDHSDVVWTFVPATGYRAYRVKRRKPLARRLFSLLLVLVIMLLASLMDARRAWGQEQPPVLPDPSKLEEQFDERRLPGSQITIQGENQERQALPPGEDIRFVLRDLVVTGATVFDADDFRPFFEQDINTEISVGRLFDIAERMSAHYRNRGYILSRVMVPAQEVQEGRVELVAVEGYIHKVSVEGDVMVSAARLARLGAKITSSRPLRAKDLERYILLANDIPGVVASAVLQASEEPGATDLTIVVSQDRARLYSTVNNRGSRFNGPVQGQIGVDLHSLFGGASRTGMRVVNSAQTSEFTLLELAHQHILNSEGTSIQLIGRKTFSKPGGSLRDLEIDSDSVSGRLVLQHPLVRTRAQSLFVRAALDVRDTETDILGEPFTEDRVRVARLGATLDFVDRFDGINLLDVELSKGLDILNATKTRDPFQSRADAETGFFKIAASATRLQRIAPKVSLMIDVAGQFTSDGLLASEEFAIGGSQFGRAFDPSEITGDRAVAGRSELRYDGTVSSPWLQRYQLYLFGDYGVVWNRIAGSYRSVDIGSAGAGIRVTLNEHLSAHAELAVPFDKTADFDERWGNSVRGFAGISLRF